VALDFRASQTRTNKLIASGSTGTNASLLVYPFSVASNLSGGLNTSLFSTSSIGTDVFLFISGSSGSLDSGSHGIVGFGGDAHVSGTLRVQGSFDVIGPIHYLSRVDATFKQFFFIEDDNPVVGNPFETFLFRANNFFFAPTDPGYGIILSSSTEIDGDLLVSVGISGSHTALADGNPAFVAGPGITIGTTANGAVTISGSSSSPSLFTVSGTRAYTTSSVSFDSSGRYPNQLGSDIFFFVSGSPQTSSNLDNLYTLSKASLFGGDLYVSGTLIASRSLIAQSGVFLGNVNDNGTVGTFISFWDGIGGNWSNALTFFPDASTLQFGDKVNTVVIAGDPVFLSGTQILMTGSLSGISYCPFEFNKGISGSLTKLTDGTSYLRAGPGVVINSSSNGAVTITGSAGTYGRLFMASYNTTNNTSSNPQVCGQNIWVPSEFCFTPSSSAVYLAAILSTTATTASLLLYNVTSGAYVEIGGPGNIAITSTSTTPERKISTNLTGAVNFVTSSQQIYEIQLYVAQNSATAILGSAELLTTV